MHNYVVVNAPADLIPQVTAEILQFTRNPDLVEVVHAAVGREIHVDPAVVEEWMLWRKAKDEGTATLVESAPDPEPEPAPEPEPVPEPEPEPEPQPEPALPPEPEPVPVLANRVPLPSSKPLPAPKKSTNAASA